MPNNEFSAPTLNLLAPSSEIYKSYNSKHTLPYARCNFSANDSATNCSYHHGTNPTKTATNKNTVFDPYLGKNVDVWTPRINNSQKDYITTGDLNKCPLFISSQAACCAKTEPTFSNSEKSSLDPNLENENKTLHPACNFSFGVPLSPLQITSEYSSNDKPINGQDDEQDDGHQWRMQTFKKSDKFRNVFKWWEGEFNIGQASYATHLDTIRTGKVVTYSLSNSANSSKKPSSAKNLDWDDNPVFKVDPTSALPSITSKHRQSTARKQHAYTFTKSMLASATVCGQLERKFIACILKLDTAGNNGKERDTPVRNDDPENIGSESILCLIDQHAAHERVRLEDFLQRICYYNISKDNQINKACCKLSPPLVLHLVEHDLVKLLHFRKDFAEIGLQFSYNGRQPTGSFKLDGISTIKDGTSTMKDGTSTDKDAASAMKASSFSDLDSFSQLIDSKYRKKKFATTRDASSVTNNISIFAIPSVFVRISATSVLSNIQRVRGDSVNKNLLLEFIREQMGHLQREGANKCTLTSTSVFKVLASHACHGAIKFGDKLSMQECTRLVQQLSSCQLPFQCAHGRPSITPLLNLDAFQKAEQAMQLSSNTSETVPAVAVPKPCNFARLRNVSI